MNFIKKNIKYIGIIMICIFCSYLTTIATNYAFDSSDVRFDNTGTDLDSVNVQDALDETFHHVTDYNDIKTTIGNGSLTTTSQNIIGAINEVSGNNNSLSDQIGDLITLSLGSYTDLAQAGQAILDAMGNGKHAIGEIGYDNFRYTFECYKYSDTWATVWMAGYSGYVFHLWKENGTWKNKSITDQIASIGSESSTNGSVSSLANATITEVASLTLSAGEYIVMRMCDFNNNATGVRRVLSTSTGTGRNESVILPAINGIDTYVQHIELLKLTEQTTIKEYAYQNSGGSLNIWPFMKAIRVK